MKTFLIAGLGNVGAEFKDTRHNLGFRLVDLLAQKHNAIFSEDILAMTATIRIEDNLVHLIKPTTFVNGTGDSVKFWISQLGLAIESLLVVTDDKDLPLGRIRIKPKGGDGRHNGLRSISAALEDNNYPRLRFGIGRDFKPGAQIDFVLGKWLEEEREVLNVHLKNAVEAVETYVTLGIQKAMTIYN